MATRLLADFNIKLQGFAPANRDATVKLVNEATGETIERKPFLDGTLLVRDLSPGFYDIEVRHPNLINAIDRRRVRLFPQPAPTVVPIPVPADLFRDTPIRDIPDADLSPVQTASTAVRDRLAPLQTKGPGEAIRAADWNTLVSAVADLANAVSQLVTLVAPKGHDHPEIAEKIDEVQGNLRRFAEAYGRSLVELQREIETEGLRRKVVSVLNMAEANRALRDRVLGKVDDLRVTLQSDTALFTSKLTSTGFVLHSALQEMAAAQGAGADAFMNQPDVVELSDIARAYVNTGTQSRAEGELTTYRLTAGVAKGAKLGRIIGG